MSTFFTKNIGVSIEDFSSIENYRKLQNRYILRCYSNSLGESPATPKDYKEDFSILVQYVTDDYNGNVHEIGMFTAYKDVYFIADYLKTEIPKLAERYEKQITESINRYYLADAKERRNYILERRHYLNKLYAQLDDFSFIGEELFGILKTETIKALEYIYDDALVEKEISKMGKIVVHLPEIDFINIMMELADNNFIRVYNDVELANIIENNFYIYKEKDEEHKPIKNCYKKINGFRNGSKPNYKSKERIRELFRNIK